MTTQLPPADLCCVFQSADHRPQDAYNRNASPVLNIRGVHAIGSQPEILDHHKISISIWLNADADMDNVKTSLVRLGGSDIAPPQTLSPAA